MWQKSNLWHKKACAFTFFLRAPLKGKKIRVLGKHLLLSANHKNWPNIIVQPLSKNPLERTLRSCCPKLINILHQLYPSFLKKPLKYSNIKFDFLISPNSLEKPSRSHRVF